MSTVHRYLPSYTVKDYLLWEGEWELWDGIAVAMTPSPFGPHSQVVALLITSLQLAIEEAGCPATVLTELDWIVSNTIVLRPDIVVVCGPRPDKHLREVPAVVVEVLSPSTYDRDQNEKRELYAQQQVEHYLFVDPEGPKITACHLASAGRYITSEVTGAIRLDICRDCHLDVDLKRLSR